VLKGGVTYGPGDCIYVHPETFDQIESNSDQDPEVRIILSWTGVILLPFVMLIAMAAVNGCVRLDPKAMGHSMKSGTANI
jgi:hypothetical protein